MKKKIHSTADKASFLAAVASLWPALKGSLALVHKPCIRPACRACARGDKHPAYLFSFTEKGRRRCMYVSVVLLPVMQRALKNGRKIEQLLYKTGPALIRQYRQSPTPPSPRHPKSGPSKKRNEKKT